MLRVAAFRAVAILLYGSHFEVMLLAAIHYVLELYSSAEAMLGGTVPSGNIIPLLSSGKFIAALTKFSFY